MTDVKHMDITGQSYGANQQTNAAQSAAPLSAPQSSGPAVPPPTAPTPLTAPTQNPNEPVTAGANAGAGPSAADIGLAQSDDAELKAKFGPLLPVLMRMADSSYATASYKRQVRQLIARINS